MDKKRVGIVLSYYASVVYFLFGIFYYLVLDSILLLLNNFVTAIISMLLSFLIKKEKIRFRTFSTILILIGYTSLLILNIILGGFTSPMLYWLLAVVLGAGFMKNTQWMLIWGFIIALTYILFFILHFNGVTIPFAIILNSNLEEIFHISSLVGVVTLAVTFCWTYIHVSQTFNQKIQESNRRNSLLLKILNHDLANPLTVLNFNLRILKEDNVDKLKPKLQRANQTVLNILSSVRSMDKIHMSQIELEEVNLLECINIVREDLDELFPNKNLNYFVEVEKDIIVNTSKTILTNHILKNILTNAAKFSQINGVIEINFENGLLEIKDFGVGIPEKNIPTLFDYKKNASTDGTQGEKGTGFGLPIVKECCDKLHIGLDVKSDSIGTSFFLKFS